jgi:HEAT repeat protein
LLNIDGAKAVEPILATLNEGIGIAVEPSILDVNNPPIEPLLAGLRSDRGYVREIAGEMLRKVSDAEIRKINEPDVRVLVAALEDEIIYVRNGAANVLRRISEDMEMKMTTKASVASLIALLHDSRDDVRFKVVNLLELIGDPLAVQPLTNLLQTAEPSISGFMIARALARIGTPEALEAVARWRREQGQGGDEK